MAQFFDAFEIVRLLRQQQGRENLLHNGSNAGEGKGLVGTATLPLPLEERVRDGREHDMMLPAGIRAPFEMIEAEFGLELLILLLAQC